MSRTRSQYISPIGIVTVTGLDVVGVATASSFVGQLNSSGVSTIANLQSTNVNVTGVSTIANLQSTNVNVTGVSTIANLQSTNINVSGTSSITSIVETQSTPSITNKTLFLNASNGTVFTHTTSSNIGIVSFSGISTAKAGTQTFTVLVTQGSTPFSTTPRTGIGTALATVVISPGGVGYSTHIKVGGGSTIILTNTAGALDILTFIVSYDGATSIANTSFKVVGFAATDFYGVVN